MARRNLSEEDEHGNFTTCKGFRIRLFWNLMICFPSVQQKLLFNIKRKTKLTGPMKSFIIK